MKWTIVITSVAAICASAIVLLLMFRTESGNLDVDYCLDSGGSFNYKNCTCDYENSHPNKEDYQCN